MNKTRESILHNMNVSRGETSKIEGSVPDLSKMEVSHAVNNEKYADQVKDYTHYIIGRKISKNVPTYS